MIGTEHPVQYEWPSNRRGDKMIEDKRWWMEPTGIRVFSEAAGRTPRDGDTEVQVIPLDAVFALSGSWLWALEMCDRGYDVGHYGHEEYHSTFDVLKHNRDTEWHLIPVPWVPKRGELVAGIGAAGHEWTGPYWGPASIGGHTLGEVVPTIWVKTVSKLGGTP